MKILLSVFLLFSSSLLAQSNFNIFQNEVIWEKVYESSIDEKEIQQFLNRSPILQPIAATFSGNTIPKEVTCKGSQSIYMRYPVQFFTHIAFKEGKYKVRVSSIAFIPTTTAQVFGVETTTQPMAWEGFILKSSGDLKTNRLTEKSMECLDKYFLQLFNFKAEATSW